VTIAGVLCGSGWTGLGLANSLPALYALYVLAGIGAALIYGGCVGSALKWFTKERGLAAGVITAGFGARTALFVALIASIIKTSGYRSAFIYTGIFQGVVILVAAQFLCHPAAQPAAAQSAAASPSDASAPTSDTVGRPGLVNAAHQFTTFEMLRTTQFFTLYASFVMMATGGLVVAAHAGSHARAWGIPAAALAAATSLNALANGGSRIFWGWLSDRTGRELALGIAFVLQALCLVLVLTLGRSSGALFTITLVL